MQRHRRAMALMIATLTLLAGAWIAPRASAQDEGAEGFPLPTLAMVCETQPTEWPFRNGGCVPVTITVTYETDDGSFSASCDTDQYGERTAGCSIDVPFSSTVIATADPSGFPEGYVLSSENPQTWEIPDGPPDGVFGGPIFIALPIMGDEPPAEEPDTEEPVTGEVSGEETTSDEPQTVTTLPVTGTGSTVADTNWFLPAALSALMLLGAGAGLRVITRSTTPGQLARPADADS